MPQQQQHTPSLLDRSRDYFNLFNFSADVITASVRPFTRVGMGTKGLGTPAFVAGVFFLPAYAGMTHSPDMILYWQAWIVMAIYARMKADRSEHTAYQGRVRIFWRFHRENELNARLMEAGAMWIVGGVLSGFSEDIGYFVYISMFAFSFKYVIDSITVAQLRDAAHNARIEMEAAQRRIQDGL
jgi:hypothetical protein